MTFPHLDDILTEWALLSPDGLASGHKSVENIEVLKAILHEHGTSPDEVSRIVSDVINDGEAAEQQLEFPTDSTTSVESRVTDLMKVKKVRREFAEKFRTILSKHPELMSIYNAAKTLDDALAIYNSGTWNGQNYRAAFVEIDDQIKHKGLGRGEMILVYLIDGCISGGSKSGDLELSDGTSVDVKEIDDSNEILVMVNSIDKYQNLGFVRALHKLKSFLESEPEAETVLTQAYQSDKTANASTTSAANIDPPILDSGLDESTLTEKTDPMLAFLHDRNVYEMGAAVFAGLAKIRDGLNKMTSGQRVPDTVTFSIGDDKKIFLLDQSEIKALRSILDKIDGKFTKIAFQAAGFDDRNAQYLIPILKSLDIFTVGSNAVTVQSIHAELIKALHYDGIVFVDNGSAHKMTYVPKSKMEDYSTSPMKFSRLSKGIKFKVSL